MMEMVNRIIQLILGGLYCRDYDLDGYNQSGVYDISVGGASDSYVASRAGVVFLGDVDVEVGDSLSVGVGVEGQGVLGVVGDFILAVVDAVVSVFTPGDESGSGDESLVVTETDEGVLVDVGDVDLDETDLGGLYCRDYDLDGYNQSGGGCGDVDCDDSSSLVYPGAVEVCGNGVDEDCDGVDEGCRVTDEIDGLDGVDGDEVVDEEVVVKDGDDAGENIPNDYVSFWKFDGDASDEKGLNDGSVVGDVGFVSGKVGSAASFDGDGDYVDFGDSYLYHGDDFTWSGWYYFNELSNNINTIFSKGNYIGSTTWSYAFHGDSNNRFKAFIAKSGSDGGNNLVQTPVNSLTVGEWHHIVIVYDGKEISSDDRLKIYIDNINQPLNVIGSIPSTIKDVSGSLKIGYWEGLSRSLNGLADEVMIYDRALSSSEVSDIYCGQGGGC